MNNSELPTSVTKASAGASSRGIVLVVVESGIFLTLDLAALVGNALVCVAFYRKSSLRTIPNVFIVSLTLADLLMAALLMPLLTSSSISDEWSGGTLGLEVFGYCIHILVVVSLFTVMLLAVNRYFRAVSITLYSYIYSKKSSTVMAVAAWIVSTVIVIVGFPVFEIHFRPSRVNPTIILPVFPGTTALIFYVTAFSLIFCVAGLVVIACYVKIYRAIRQRKTANVQASQEGETSYGHGVKKEEKTTRILTFVLIGFGVCCLIPFITGVLNCLSLINESSRKYENFYYTFPSHCSSVINPLIYATMSRPFRREFLKILCRHCFV